MLAWLERIWPLVWKSRMKAWEEMFDQVCRERGQIADKLKAEKDRANVAEAKVDRLLEIKYKEMTDFANRYNCHQEVWDTSTNKMIRFVEENMYTACYVSAPKIGVELCLPLQPASFHQVDLLVFSQKIGLSQDCPPEFIARKVTNQLEAAILEKWKNQSLGTKKENQ